MHLGNYFQYLYDVLKKITEMAKLKKYAAMTTSSCIYYYNFWTTYFRILL